MGTTTFSGPIKAGDKKDAPNANLGFVSMAQSAAVTEVNAFGTTSIVIPANSQITNIYVLVTTAFDGGTNTIDVGISSDTDLFVDGLSVSSVGNHRVGAAQTGTEANWKNVGTSDQTIVFISPQTGNGAGILTVEYLQNRSLA
tara:strand:+ start:64 stop:492 length:429 start_codon:yes stop_codon:yes gene_type:complete